MTSHENLELYCITDKYNGFKTLCFSTLLEIIWLCLFLRMKASSLSQLSKYLLVFADKQNDVLVSGFSNKLLFL